MRTLSTLSDISDKDIHSCLVLLAHFHSVIRHPWNASHVPVTAIDSSIQTRPCLLMGYFSAVHYSLIRGYFPAMEPLGGGYFSGVEAGVVEKMTFVCLLTPLILPQIPEIKDHLWSFITLCIEYYTGKAKGLSEEALQIAVK